MARCIFALLLFSISNVEAQSLIDWWDTLTKTPEPLIGLLDLSDIVHGGCPTNEKRATARLFNAPSQNGGDAGTLHMRDEKDACALMIELPGGTKEELPTLESGYEIPAAIVFERRSDWFRIRLMKGSAWIRRSTSEDFLAYPDGFRRKLTYMVNGWGGVLRETPNPSGKVIPLASGWTEFLDRGVSVEILEFRRLGTEQWVRVRSATHCHEKLPAEPFSGWVRAYRTDRAPNIWFSSRGC